jgi:F-type H+-transporting ATPase subunit b
MSATTVHGILGSETHNSFYGNVNELIWGSAAFAILFILFLWKGVPAVKKAAAARQQRIAGEIAQAEAARAEADAELAALLASLGNAEADAGAILAEARARAATVKADLIARAEAEIAETKQRARLEIEASKQQSLADLQAEVAAMTIAATQAVVHDNLTDAVKSDLVEQFITQLGAAR